MKRGWRRNSQDEESKEDGEKQEATEEREESK